MDVTCGKHLYLCAYSWNGIKREASVWWRNVSFSTLKMWRLPMHSEFVAKIISCSLDVNQPRWCISLYLLQTLDSFSMSHPCKAHVIVTLALVVSGLWLGACQMDTFTSGNLASPNLCISNHQRRSTVVPWHGLKRDMLACLRHIDSDHKATSETVQFYLWKRAQHKRPRPSLGWLSKQTRTVEQIKRTLPR